MTVTGNIIGYASNTQTGTYTLTGSTGTFRGIRFNGITGGTVSNINSNTIASVSLTGVTSSGTGTSSPFSAILINSGLVNTNSNTIGSQSGTGSLTFSTTTTSSTDVYGIYNFSSDDWTANSNNIGGISVTNAAASGTFIIYGMRANTLTSKVFNAVSNNIGGTVANSIQLTATGTSSQVVGLVTSNAAATFTSNTIRNLTTNIGTGTTSSASMIGMMSTTTSTNHTFSQNTIHTLTNTNATAASVVTGIQFTGSTANVVERNLIYNLLAPTSSTSAEINGIRVAGGTTTYRNNMIALGANQAIAIGSAATNSGTTGINGFNGALGTDAFVHNSIYIGGTATSGSGASYALNGSQTTNTRSFRDNIFFNARTNSGATGKHYAVKINGTTPNPTGLTINNNIYYVNGTGGVFGFFNSADVADLAAWKTAVGQDAQSFSADPQYNDPTNATPDLHLHPTNATVAEGNGADVGVTNDYDGQTRASFTPVDIGADAGNYTGLDLTGPAISYTNLTNTTSTSNRSFTGVTITDNSGVNGTAGTRPRVYYKRSTDGNVLNDNTSGTDGWKYAEASGGTSPFSFTIDYSLLNGGTGVTVGQTVQYFVVAQDLATTPNVGINSGTFAATPSSVALTSAAFPIGGTINSYSVLVSYSGSYNVGAGETFTSLTAAGGLFAAINAGVVTGSITVNITSDISIEDGANSLNQWTEEGAGNYTLTIRPDFGASAGDSPLAVRTVSGTNATALINLNGADRVTINGVNGSNSLLLRNTGAGAVIRFINDASTNTVQNTTLESGVTSTTSGVIHFSTGATSGNDNNTISNNTIRDRSDAAGVPANLLYSAGTSAAIANTDNIVSNNTMKNFTSNGINLTSTGNQSWVIIGNSIFQEAPRTTSLTGINFNSLGDSFIQRNTIRDLNTSSSVTGINLDDAFSTNCSRNKIFSIPSTSGSTSTLTGINYAGGSGLGTSVTIVNNQISIVPLFSNAQTIYGIRDFAFSGNTITMYYNSVLVGGTATGSATWAMQRGGSTPTTLTARNNIFFNNRTGGSANHFAMGDESANTGSWTSDHNVFVGTGTTAANFMDYGTSATAVSFSTWKTGPPTRDENSHGEVAANVSAANLFTNIAGGTEDLNINTANTESWYVNGKGVAGTLSGFVEDDYGATSVRSSTVGTPTDIGADEFNTASIPPSATASGAPANSTTTTYTFAGRTLGSITWGAGGTVPSSVDFRYHSGTLPPPFVTGQANFIRSYWDISVPDGSGYTYDLTLNYLDPAEINEIPELNLAIAQRTGGNPWINQGGAANSTANTVTVAGLTGFSQFTLNDNTNPLPIVLASFTAREIRGQGVRLDWRTLSEINNYGFFVQRRLQNTTAWTDVNTQIIPGHGTTNEPHDYTYTDRTVTPGSWQYRLRQLDFDGTEHFSEPITVTTVTSVKEVAPIEFALKQNYPNPFNPETSIKFSVEQTGRATLEIFNLLGQKVATLFDDVVEAGFYETVRFNATNLASGIYFYRLQSGQKSDLKKLMLIR